MFGRIFSFPGASVLWASTTAVLAAALVVTSLQAQRHEAFLRARISALASHDASQLQAELVSCRSTVHSYAAVIAAAAPRPTPVRAHATKIKAATDAGSVAAALVSTPPAGIDVCARMESADQAVMKALDRR